MFRNLLNRLFVDESAQGQIDRDDAEVALAALLVRVARADDAYHKVEQQRIEQILSRRHGLTAAQAGERRAAAEMIEAEAPDTVRFTRIIKDRIALDDRLGVVEAMWEVTYSDEDRGAEEESLIRLVSGLLGIPDRDSALARQRVLDQMGLDRGA